MSLMLIAALQAAAPAAPERILRSDFDLAEVRPEDRDRLALDPLRGCDQGSAGEILVCGRRTSGEDYPMEERPPQARSLAPAQSSSTRRAQSSSIVSTVPRQSRMNSRISR